MQPQEMIEIPSSNELNETRATPNSRLSKPTKNLLFNKLPGGINHEWNYSPESWRHILRFDIIIIIKYKLPLTLLLESSCPMINSIF